MAKALAMSEAFFASLAEYLTIRMLLAPESTLSFSRRLVASHSSIVPAPPVSRSHSSRTPGWLASLRSRTTLWATLPLAISSIWVKM